MCMWNEKRMNDVLASVIRSVRTEFSDVPDVDQATRIIVRLTVAALLGGILGWQRESHGKAAGLRTHMLVSMGSALFVLVALQAGVDTANSSRVIQGVIAGIGFLGAGTILKAEGKDSEPHVKGLTTAAGIWLTAAIGICAGLGKETTAVISTVLAMLVLSAVPILTKKKD